MSLLQEEGIWSTNPMFLTNREDALSPDGQEQVQVACQTIIQDENAFPTIIKYSLAAACIDAADIVGHELEIGRDRIVPEFTFLDPRAIGQWDMQSKKLVEPAVWAMDVDEAGNDGSGGRPPPNEDGTFQIDWHIHFSYTTSISILRVLAHNFRSVIFIELWNTDAC
jgi:hypothetical protein